MTYSWSILWGKTPKIGSEIVDGGGEDVNVISQLIGLFLRNWKQRFCCLFLFTIQFWVPRFTISISNQQIFKRCKKPIQNYIFTFFMCQSKYRIIRLDMYFQSVNGLHFKTADSSLLYNKKTPTKNYCWNCWLFLGTWSNDDFMWFKFHWKYGREIYVISYYQELSLVWLQLGNICHVH